MARFLGLFFLANYLFNLSLTKTKVSSATLISSTSGFFTLFFSMLMSTDKPRGMHLKVKFFIVCVSVCGVILVTLSDSSEESKGKIY